MKTLNFSKRLLCAVIAFTIATFIGVPFVSAETEGPFQYSVINGKAYITKCDKSVQGHLDIPDTLGGAPVVSIGYESFMGCKKLTSITFPESITELHSWSFANTGIISITIPQNILLIDGGVFSECSSLKEIIVEDENPNYVSIDGVLFTKDLTELKQYPTGKADLIYTIPDGVKKISHWSFSCNPYLQKVILPDTVTTVIEDAFYHCISLTNVFIGSDVTEIGSGSFGMIYDSETGMTSAISEFIMHGYAGTKSEQYCLKYQLTFDVLNQKGDCNHDNIIDAKDALTTLQLSVSKILATPGLVQVTDVNTDTLVNAKDALEILKKSVNKPACF